MLKTSTVNYLEGLSSACQPNVRVELNAQLTELKIPALKIFLYGRCIGIFFWLVLITIILKNSEVMIKFNDLSLIVCGKISNR